MNKFNNAGPYLNYRLHLNCCIDLSKLTQLRIKWVNFTISKSNPRKKENLD